MTNLRAFDFGFERLLSKHEASDLLGISLSSLDRLMRANKISYVRVGVRRIGFRKQDIDEYNELHLKRREDARTQRNVLGKAVAAK